MLLRPPPVCSTHSPIQQLAAWPQRPLPALHRRRHTHACVGVGDRCTIQAQGSKLGSASTTSPSDRTLEQAQTADSAPPTPAHAGSTVLHHLASHLRLCAAAALQFIQKLLRTALQLLGLSRPQPSVSAVASISAASATPIPLPGASSQSVQLESAQQQQQQQQPQRLSRKQRRRALEEEQMQQQSAVLEPVPSAAPSSAVSQAQQRTVSAFQGLQQTSAYTAFSSLSPLQRVGGGLLLLLAFVVPQVMLHRARARAAEAEAEKLRQANAQSLKLQKQRLKAALAFDAVQLDLPGIKESDVDPSTLVAKANSPHPAELEGAIRKEWLQFMSASKVGMVTDLWDANSSAHDFGPAATRAELEEMTRRVREANRTAGSTRHRGGRDAGDQGADDGWFLTKEDKAATSRERQQEEEEREAQIDAETMEERAARRRARLSGEFASDEDVASMWTARRAAAGRPGQASAPPGPASRAHARAGGSTNHAPTRSNSSSGSGGSSVNGAGPGAMQHGGWQGAGQRSKGSTSAGAAASAAAAMSAAATPSKTRPAVSSMAQGVRAQALPTDAPTDAPAAPAVAESGSKARLAGSGARGAAGVAGAPHSAPRSTGQQRRAPTSSAPSSNSSSNSSSSYFGSAVPARQRAFAPGGEDETWEGVAANTTTTTVTTEKDSSIAGNSEDGVPLPWQAAAAAEPAAAAAKAAGEQDGQGAWAAGAGGLDGGHKNAALGRAGAWVGEEEMGEGGDTNTISRQQEPEGAGGLSTWGNGYEQAQELQRIMEQDADDERFVASPEHTSPLLASRGTSASSSSSSGSVLGEAEQAGHTEAANDGMQPSGTSTSTSVQPSSEPLSEHKEHTAQAQAGEGAGAQAPAPAPASRDHTVQGTVRSTPSVAGSGEGSAASNADAEAMLARLMRRPTLRRSDQ